MDKKQKITNILLEEFEHVYCDNCKFQEDDEGNCNECHKKYINWSLHPSAAEALAEKIIHLEETNTSNCKKCVHYYIDYYTPSMPFSCRSLKTPIDSLNIINCPYFIERPKNFILSEDEINSLDSFIKHFND